MRIEPYESAGNVIARLREELGIEPGVILRLSSQTAGAILSNESEGSLI